MLTAATLASLLLLAAPPQAMAAIAQPAADCATPTPLPLGLEGWAASTAVKAGASAATAPALTIGAAVTATLLPTPAVAYPVRSAKPGEPASSGGVFAFAVAAPGRYRVALGAGAWIDVLSGAAPVASVAHGHGPACSGVRKMVDFDLKPGRYLIQVVGSASPRLTMMVARAPL